MLTRAVPGAGVAPTLIELVAAIVAAVFEVPVTTPFIACGATTAVPLTLGEVVVVAGTTVPLAGVAPTPRAPVTARGDAVATPPPPPTTPPRTPWSPKGELTHGVPGHSAFTSPARTT